MANLDATLQLLHLFGDPTRVRLVALLGRDELTVAELTTITELGQSRVSTHLGRLKDAGSMTPQQVSLAKRSNVSMATDVAREARRLLGAVGVLAEYASMRHMANLESVYTYEGTHDVHSLVLGQAITGLNAFS